jgi:hypothetical protein
MLLRCSVCFGWLYLGSTDSAASPHLRLHAFLPNGCTDDSLDGAQWTQTRRGIARARATSFSSSGPLLFDWIGDVSALSPANEPAAPGARRGVLLPLLHFLLDGRRVVEAGILRYTCLLALVPDPSDRG